MRGRGVVLEAAAGLPGKPPVAERCQQLVAISPMFRRERRAREASRVQQHLLHRHRVLAVGSELRHDLRHALVQAQQLILE